MLGRAWDMFTARTRWPVCAFATGRPHRHVPGVFSGPCSRCLSEEYPGATVFLVNP